MTIDQRIQAFSKLGTHLSQLNERTFASVAEGARLENPWFTPDNVKLGLEGIAWLLDPAKLTKWSSGYELRPQKPKTVAIVMAGNIPLVGFHDLLSVLISGHYAQVKLSSKDASLSQYVIDQLARFEPEFSERISVQSGLLKGFDAVIATGSNNSARYFKYYFRKYPHIIRKNRTSVALLTGKESEADLQALGKDIFSYFGQGCRNISKIFIPEGYDLKSLTGLWEDYAGIIHHHKYANNYDYQKSILIINQIPFLDNGFVLLQESEKLVSPISVLYYQYYTDKAELNLEDLELQEKIQCIVGNVVPATIRFGEAQRPEVWDYADRVDTLKFLSGLN